MRRTRTGREWMDRLWNVGKWRRGYQCMIYLQDRVYILYQAHICIDVVFKIFSNEQYLFKNKAVILFLYTVYKDEVKVHRAYTLHGFLQSILSEQMSSNYTLTLSARGPSLEFGIWRRKTILTYQVGPRTERIKHL